MFAATLAKWHKAELVAGEADSGRNRHPPPASRAPNAREKGLKPGVGPLLSFCAFGPASDLNRPSPFRRGMH